VTERSGPASGAGRVLTPDLGGQARTSEVGDEVVARLRSS